MYNYIGIIGYGEIGRALDALYIENEFLPLIRDVDRDDGLGQVDVLNIAIPFSDTFIKDVSQYIEEIAPKELVIIHSTVPPGTTEKVSKVFPRTVHSPVRGVHPTLLEGFKTFTKIVGGDGANEAADHLENDLGIDACVYESSRATEVAKLLDTSYYGVCIAWHDYAFKLREALDVSFDEAMTKYNFSYNRGYSELGKEEVIRPILSPPDGRIGGHCVVHNAELLRHVLDSPLLRAVTDLK